MDNEGTTVRRNRDEFARRVGDGVQKRLRGSGTNKLTHRMLVLSNEEKTASRVRFVLLDMGNPCEAEMVQVLYNSPERFRIIDKKESHQRGEYLIRMIFEELGEGLPVIKSQQELIHEYVGGDSLEDLDNE